MASRVRRWLGVGRCTGRGVVWSLVMNMRHTASPSNGEWKVGNSCQALSAVEASISVECVTELRFITIAGRTMSDPVEIVGFVTHGIVFAIGVGGVLRIVPLARGRRAGAGLILMAVSMTILVVAPRLASPSVGAVVYAIGFVVALWLLLGPDRQRVRRK